MTTSPEPTSTASAEPIATASPEPTSTVSPEPGAADSMERVADSLDLLNGQIEVLVIAAGLLLLFVVFLAVMAVRR